MHTPALLQEVLEGLSLKAGDTVLDGTVGDGGHAEEICKKIGTEGTLVGIDQDRNALEYVRWRLKSYPCRVFLEQGNFKDLKDILGAHKIYAVDKALFDLGLRSGQLENSGRGFSFRKNEPLLMTFDAHPKDGALTAYEIVNSWSKEELAKIFKEYGEESFARRIAEGIIQERKNSRIGTTEELVRVIEKNVPQSYKRARLHFATKTFQALRVAVNDEIRTLEAGLSRALTLLRVHGRCAVITFHSGEDRVVKNIFKKYEADGSFKRITKKPIFSSTKEREDNPRSRSAKLRILEKIL